MISSIHSNSQRSVAESRRLRPNRLMGSRTLALRRSRSRNRRGLSLLEVILAITILGLSAIAIGQLIGLGTRSASAARTYATAHLLCETKVAEIRAGVLPLDAVSKAEIAESPEWVYSVTKEYSDINGILIIEVKVEQAQQTGAYAPIDFSITRHMPDPDYEETLEAEDEALNGE